MDQEFFTQDGSMADAKLKNEEVSRVGTGIAWEVKSHTNPHSDEYVAVSYTHLDVYKSQYVL